MLSVIVWGEEEEMGKGLEGREEGEDAYPRL